MGEGQHPSLVPRWTVAVHAVQILFAVVILGFDAYGIKYIAYNALIFSLVVCLCTMAVAAYLIASQTIIPKMYNVYVALALHIWILIFWVVDLGLVANLAAMWGRGDYCFTTSYGFGSTYCYLKKRDLIRRDTTTFGAYYGILTAGAVFAAIQLVTWALTAILLVLAWNRSRHGNATTTTGGNPPQYQNGTQAVPMEKYNATAATPTYASPQPQSAQPAQFAGAPYAQDPVQRQDTVSPVSHAGYAASGVSSPQHTGQHGYVGNQQQQQHTQQSYTQQSYTQQSYPTGATEVHTDPYNPNVPELANGR